MAKFVPLNKLCTMDITDGTHKTPTYSEQGYIFLSSKNVTAEKIDWDEVKYIPEDLHQELYRRIAPQKDDILLAKNGTTGVAAIVDRDVVFDIYVSLALIRPNQEIVIPKYLLYAINSDFSKRYFNSHLKGVGVPNLHLTHIRETPIKVPSLDEQQKIVNNLEQISDVIQLRHKQLVNLEKLVKSRFIEMFGDLSEEAFVTMEDVCKIITDGTHQPPKFVSEGIPFLFVSNIVTNEITYNTEKFITPETYAELIKRTPIEVGDILLSTVGSYGHPAIVKSEKLFCFQRHIAYLKPDTKMVNSEYVKGAILSFDVQRQIDERVKGIAQKTLNLSEIRKLRLPLPPLDLQNQFADFVAQVDKSKLAVQKSLEQLEILKKALMQEYFG
ncbi:MAG: restriction endonuclease subunit S [Peptococcaceae bacterium]